MGGFAGALSGQNMYQDNDRFKKQFTPEPIEGNSMTQYLRSMNNWSGNSGQNVFNTGGQMAGQSGDYWSKIVSGNPAAIAQAMAPTINATNASYKQQQDQVNQFAPMGGGRANQMAQLPFQRAGAISNIIAQAQPFAAQQLGALGTTEQQTGLAQLQQALQSLLTMRGQDVTEHGQAMGLAGTLGSSMLQGIGQGYAASVNAGAY